MRRAVALSAVAFLLGCGVRTPVGGIDSGGPASDSGDPASDSGLLVDADARPPRDVGTPVECRPDAAEPPVDAGGGRITCEENHHTGCPAAQPYCCVSNGSFEFPLYECFEPDIFDAERLEPGVCGDLPCGPEGGHLTGCVERTPSCLVDSDCIRYDGVRDFFDSSRCPASLPICCRRHDLRPGVACVDHIPVGWQCGLPDGTSVVGREP